MSIATHIILFGTILGMHAAGIDHDHRLVYDGRPTPRSERVTLVATPDALTLERDSERVGEIALRTTRFEHAVCEDNGPVVAVTGERDEGSLLVLWRPGQEPVVLPLAAAAVSPTRSRAGEDGCLFSFVDASGTLHLVNERAREHGVVEGFLPGTSDATELESGLALSLDDARVVASDSLGSVARWSFSQEQQTRDTIDAPLVGALVSTPDGVWGLSREGSLWWFPAEQKDHPVRVVETRRAATSGLTIWGGAKMRGIAWADRVGHVHIFDGEHRSFAAFEGMVRWPLLAADFFDEGDLELAGIDDAGMLVVMRERDGEVSIWREEVGVRPMDAPALVRPDPNAPTELLVPNGTHSARARPFTHISARGLAIPGAALGASRTVAFDKPVELPVLSAAMIPDGATPTDENPGAGGEDASNPERTPGNLGCSSAGDRESPTPLGATALMLLVCVMGVRSRARA